MSMRAGGVSAVTACLLLSGCAVLEDPGPTMADGLQVATAFYPLQYVAQRVVGDLGTVSNLTRPGQEPHDLSLTVQETAALTTADVVVHEQGLQPAVDAAVRQDATGVVIDAAAVVDLDTDASGTPDPHFWLDPLRMARLADEIAAALSRIDPDHARQYQTQAGQLRADLEDLDAEYRAGLASCQRQTVVVSHDAFGYLQAYGLVMQPIAGLSPDAEPTPADLARLQDLIREEGIITVFSERLVSPRLTESLAEDLDIATAVLDPIEGLSAQTSQEDYLSLMRQNLAALQVANGC